jgi:CO/xanthine dehydrogenase FAD-binding subunit
MIKEYFRPESVEKAVQILSRENGILKPLGGGTYLSRHQKDTFGVVDLQSAGMDKIETRGQRIVAGAMVRLNDLLDHDDVQDAIKDAILADQREWTVDSLDRAVGARCYPDLGT